MSLLSRIGALAFAVLAVAGCTSSDEAADGVPSRPRAPQPSFSDLTLAPSAPDVRTIQLYRGDDETTLPILPLDAADGLTLEFDLMQDVGEPVTLYFYHADRTWQRDLSPAEYMAAYRQEDLIDYTISASTEVPYVHYEYSFPNETIRFDLSGNYIVRVARQGAEDEVLFERPFFVTERSVAAELQFRELMVGGGAFPSVQTLLLFTPPADMDGGIFDYQTCFLRNGRIESGRCSERSPRRVESALAFELDPDRAFEAVAANFFVDLSEVDLGGRVESLNRAAQPDEVVLEPDYAQFTGSLEGPPINGQTVVSHAVRNPRADVQAEYVNVTFSYVPPNEQQLDGDLLLSGSFNDWRYDPAYRLEWDPASQRYVGTFLLKQGWYEYQYLSDDESVQRELANSLPARQNRYTALVYYDDVSRQTDRLVAVSVAAPGEL